MANTAVLEAYQKLTDKPMKRIKRSGGQSLVARGLAVWIVKNVLLKMLEARQAPPLCAALGRQDAPWRAYIPSKMPPVEVPGVYFEDPRDPLRPLSQVVSFQQNAPDRAVWMAVEGQ